jgi:hypothetical protein
MKEEELHDIQIPLDLLVGECVNECELIRLLLFCAHAL